MCPVCALKSALESESHATSSELRFEDKATLDARADLWREERGKGKKLASETFTGAPIDLLTRARVQVHRVSSGLLERRIIIRAFWYLAPQILVFNMKLTHARIAPYECF